MDVLGRQLDGGLDRGRRELDLVMLLEIGLQALHDLDGILDRRLLDVDLLEAAHQRAVLLEVLAVFLVGGRADAAHRARLQRGLQQVRRIHGAARRRAGADDGVDLVDEEDRALVVLDLLHDGLQPLLEIAAIARAGQQRAHVEREDRRVAQDLGHFAVDDLARQTFGDRRLADAGIADIERVVLLAAAQHLDRALHLGLAADQRIDLAVLGLLVEVDAVGVECVLPLTLLVLAIHGRAILIHALDPTRLRHAGALGNAVADILHGIEPCHILLLQEKCGMALAFRENRDQHVGARHLLAARGLHVHDGAMHDALEARRRLRFGAARRDQVFEFVVEELGQALAQLVQIDVAGPHARRRRRGPRSATTADARASRTRGCAGWRS